MAKIYPKQTKQKARNLRAQGWSLGEIGHKMKISKNTLSGWVKDIHLTKKQKERIKQKTIAAGAIGRPLAKQAWREKIYDWQESIRKKAAHFGQLPFQNLEIGKLICGILYLCEGSKYPSSTAMIFGNSDPYIIQTFLTLLRKYFSIKEEKLRCRIIPRWDQDIDKLQSFWSDITKIPLNKFYKTKPDIRTKEKVTKKIDYKGVCVVIYCDTSLQFELQSIGEIVIINGAEGS